MAWQINKMAAEEDEVDIEGIGEDEDLMDYKDMVENADINNYSKKGNLERSSASFFSEFCDPSSWFVDPNSVLSLDHCQDEKSRATIEKMIMEEELYSHGYGRMLEVPTTPVSTGTNKNSPPSKKSHSSPKAKKCATNVSLPTSHRKPWTKKEQEMFEKGLEKHGRSWTRIASMIDTRTVLQVKNFANQFFKNKEKIKIVSDEHPEPSGVDEYGNTKVSLVEKTACNSTGSTKSTMDTGPLVHIEKTTDEEEIEVDIDGDVDMEAADVNPSKTTDEVYEALLKSVSDSEDSTSDSEESLDQEEVPSQVDQSTEPKDVTMVTTIDTINQSSAVHEQDEKEDLTKEILGECHSEKLNEMDLLENKDQTVNIQKPEDTQPKSGLDCSSGNFFLDKDFESNLNKIENDLDTTCESASKESSLSKDVSCNEESSEISLPPLRDCMSVGEATCSQSTSSDTKRLDIQDPSQMDLHIDRDQIHDLEKLWNQEFFMGRSLKTPNRYVKIRNHILDMWDKCKPSYLYKTSVRTGLRNCGDVNSIGRIHAFLEDIGAINIGCPEKPRPRMRQISESENEVVEDPPPMESWVNFLRPRKRRIKDEDGDWINETTAEGLTISHHHTAGNDEDQRQDQPIKRTRAPRKKVSYNPFLLVPCKKFPSSSAHPFMVVFQSDALVIIDVHSHLSTTEVIGLLGGTYCATERVLKVIRAAPCKSLSTGMQCEMDPVSQTQASEELASSGLSVVGWYHSHPTFAPNPSVRDIETQGKFQEWFGKGGAPFVGVIASPYNYSNTSNQSQITTLTVSDEWEAADQFRLPYEFDYSILESVTDWTTVIDCVNKLETQYRCYEFRMPMTRRYSSYAFTALDKLVESLRPRLRGPEEQQQGFINELRNTFISDDAERWSNERQETSNEN